MAIDMQELLLGQQAKSLDHTASMNNHLDRLLGHIANTKYSEVDLLQASAAKELSKAGMGTDLASMRPPALPRAAEDKGA